VFLVVDEASQYVHDDGDRMLKLQSWLRASASKGGAWLATGQQSSTKAGIGLAKLKDRFPSALRVHLSSANIRDVVVHRRLPARRSPRSSGCSATPFRQAPSGARRRRHKCT
jgi:hypothetical protein